MSANICPLLWAIGATNTALSSSADPTESQIPFKESTPDKSLADAFEPIDFVGLSVPFFILCVLLEFIFAPWTGTRIRLSDALGSMTAGSYSRILNLFGISASSLFYPGKNMTGNPC